MNNQSSNEPAFPFVAESYNPMSGLTKREYFAVLTLQGLCGGAWRDMPLSNNMHNTLINTAVKLADLLLAELEKDT